MKLCHQLLRLERQHKDFLKAIWNSHINLFFLFYLELKRKGRLYIPVVPSKTIPDFRPKWVKSTFDFRPERRKNHTLWGAHTYMAYIKEYPSGSVCKGRPRFLSCQFPSKYSRRLFVLSLMWLPWLDKITCMHPNEHCYRERQPGDVTYLLFVTWSIITENKEYIK